MCSLCATCVIECYCPRCPRRAGRLNGYPPHLQACGVCGDPDDRNCTDPVCTIIEHHTLGGKLFCQMCVEATHAIRFPRAELGMYCPAHEDAYKTRMRATAARFGV